MSLSYPILEIKPDKRPPKKGWATGHYINICCKCKEEFLWDKRSSTCADCAYKEEIDRRFL